MAAGPPIKSARQNKRPSGWPGELGYPVVIKATRTKIRPRALLFDGMTSLSGWPIESCKLFWRYSRRRSSILERLSIHVAHWSNRQNHHRIPGRVGATARQLCWSSCSGSRSSSCIRGHLGEGLANATRTRSKDHCFLPTKARFFSFLRRHCVRLRGKSGTSQQVNPNRDRLKDQYTLRIRACPQCLREPSVLDSPNRPIIP